MKKCTKCKDTKLFSEFGPDKRHKDGLQSQCRECRGKTQQTYARTHKEERREYLQRNEEAIKRKQCEYVETQDGRKAQNKAGVNQRLKFPQKIKARKAVNHAVRDGKLLRPNHCEGCYQEKLVQGHHWSYLEEHGLDVEWLCPKCHRELHKELLLV